MNKTAAILIILFASLSVSAQNKTATAKRVDVTKKQLRPVEDYVASIQAFVEKQAGPHLVIADVADYNSSDVPEWARFESAEEYESDGRDSFTTAYIWKRKGKVVQVNFTYSSPSGDWAQYVFCTFYSNGNVAKIDRELRTFMDDIIVSRVFFYNSKRKLLKESRIFRDLRTKEPVPALEAFEDIDVEIYKRTGELPFATLISNRPIDAKQPPR